MASIITQADLEKGLVPIEAESFATSKGEVSKTGMHVPDLDMIDGKNIMPTIGGYTSFFGKASKIGSAVGPDKIQKPITYRTYSGNTIVLAFARDGLYIKSLAGDDTGAATVTETGTEVTVELEDALYLGWTKVFSTSPTGVWENWTWGILKNKIYLYQKGMNVILRLDGDQYGKIILTKLNPTYIIGTGLVSQITIHAQETYTVSGGISDTYKQLDYKVNNESIGIFKQDMIGYGNIAANPIKWEGLIADSNVFNVQIDKISEDTLLKANGIMDPYEATISKDIDVWCTDPNAEATITFSDPDPGFFGTKIYGYTIEISIQHLALAAALDDIWFEDRSLYPDPQIMNFNLTISINGNVETKTLNLRDFTYNGVEDEKTNQKIMTFFSSFSNLTFRSIRKYNNSPSYYDRYTIITLTINNTSDIFPYYDQNNLLSTHLLEHPDIDAFYWTELSPQKRYPVYQHLGGIGTKFIEDYILDPKVENNKNYNDHYYITFPEEYRNSILNYSAQAIEFVIDIGGTGAHTYSVSVTGAECDSTKTIFEIVNLLYQRMWNINYDFFVLDSAYPDQNIVGYPWASGANPSMTSVVINPNFNFASFNIINPDAEDHFPFCIVSAATKRGKKTTYYHTGYTDTDKLYYNPVFNVGFIGRMEFNSIKPPIYDCEYWIIDNAKETIYKTIPVTTNTDIIAALPNAFSEIPWDVIKEDAQVTYDIILTRESTDNTDIDTVELAQSGSSLWSFDPTLTTPVVLPQVEGIASGRNRLIAWTKENRIHSSSAADPVDFTPSKTTQANEVSVNSIRGNIVHVQGSDDGFVIYATGNIVIASYTGEQFIYKYDAIKNSSGVIDPRHITGDLSTHFYWSNLGLFQITPGEKSIKQLAPELTDWINKYKFPIWLSLISNRFLQIGLQYAPDTLSYRNQREKPMPSLVDYGKAPFLYTPDTIVSIPLLLFGRDLYPTFKRTIFFDTLLGKWGTCDSDHKVIYSLNPINQQGFPIEKDYFLSNVQLHNELRGLAIVDKNGQHWVANDHPSDSYCVFGKWRSHRRKESKLVEVFTEFVNKPTDTVLQLERSLDGKLIYDITQKDTGATEVVNEQGINLAGKWFNILVRGTSYHIKRLMARGYTYGR